MTYSSAGTYIWCAPLEAATVSVVGIRAGPGDSGSTATSGIDGLVVISW